MDDLISRQAAIDEVNRLAEFFWEKWHEHAPSTIAVTDALKEIPSAQQWIPCDEGLPEELALVLVSDGRKTRIAYRKGFLWYHESCLGDIEAWMPLPEPYRGGE